MLVEKQAATVHSGVRAVWEGGCKSGEGGGVPAWPSGLTLMKPNLLYLSKLSVI